MAPVIRLARQLNPQLKTLGIVWNPAESNFEIFTVEARRVSKGLGIELLEATVHNSAGVFEAAISLAARGAEPLLMSGR